MKIAVLGTRGFPGVQGGIEKHCEQLYTRLAKNGCDITVFARKPYVSFDHCMYKGVSVIAVDCTTNKYLEAVIHTFVCMVKARKLKPDILHIHGIGPSLYVPLARLLGFKIVITSHGPDYKRMKWPIWAKFCLRIGERIGSLYADEIITITKGIADDIKNMYRRNSNIIPNGVDRPIIVDSDESLKKFGLQKQKYVLTVGRFVPEKGFHDLIEAFNRQQTSNHRSQAPAHHSDRSKYTGQASRKSQDDKWKLVIVGSADHEDHYSRELKLKAKKNNCIILTGSLRGLPLEELYSHAGLFVLPSYYEGLSIVLLEAMSYGLSCVVSDITPNKYVGLSDDRYFKVGRVDLLEEKLKVFLNKPLKQEEKKEQIEMVAEKYSWDNIASETLKVYDSILHKKEIKQTDTYIEAHEYKQFNFLGTTVDCITYGDMYERVDKWLENKNGRSHHIAVINAYCATMALNNHKLSEIYNRADLVGPDGMPFVYWMRVFCRHACDEFDASSILLKLIERAESTNYTFYLYGGYPEVIEKMKHNLKEQYPYINIIGDRSPPFRELTEEEKQEVCEEINRLKPDILCVSLGTPKQDFWIDEHINKIRGSVIIPCGAIFDFFGGRIKRAPRLIRQMCIEWLYRLFSKDFKRLWFRYTIMNFVFVWKFFLQLIGFSYYKQLREKRHDDS
jgi:exopolysaccharide biosynthesis WecB/TagA/CpsF family protein